MLEAQLVRREHAAKGGKTRQETREEDDEPEWMSRAVDIAAKARAADPTIHGTTIINEQILPRCEGMVGLPKFDMLMKHMARWEATGLVPRKTKAKLLSAVPRGKRKILRPL